MHNILLSLYPNPPMKAAPCLPFSWIWKVVNYFVWLKFKFPMSGQVIVVNISFLWRHRWELPLLCYHSIRVNYPYPFLGVIVLVILHYFNWQNYHKNQSYCYPFFLIMVNYPIFSLNDHILYFQMYFQYLSFLQKYPNNVSKTCNILQFLE